MKVHINIEARDAKHLSRILHKTVVELHWFKLENKRELVEGDTLTIVDDSKVRVGTLECVCERRGQGRVAMVGEGKVGG